MKAVKAKAKRTKKAGTAKKTTKEGVKRKTATNKTTNKATNTRTKKAKEEKEEALKNEALEFYRQLKERNLPHFDGASIDFHRKRDPVVFIPGEKPILTAVRREELVDFLKANDVRRVLVDALFPSRVPILIGLLQNDIEVYVLRRPTALTGFKAMMLRRLRRNKRDEDLDDNDKKLIELLQRKNDYIDAVALAFTWPKFHRKVDIPYLICWRAMNRWRRSYMLYYKVQQMLSEDEDESPVVTLHEDRLIEKARKFVDTVERHFPGIRRVFEEVRIPPDDVIAQALCCEVVLEVYHIPKKSDVMKKAGISVLPVPKRRKRKEAKENESKDEPENKRKKGRKKSFQHDGRLLFAINQLTIKLYHLNPKKDQKKIGWKAPKLLRRIWKCSRELQVTEENGRVGEALGVSGPSRKGRDFSFDTRPHGLGALLPQGNHIRYGAFQGPRHPADRPPQP